MAGLWVDKDNPILLLSLVWIAANDCAIKRSKSYCAPSWSWASLLSPTDLLSAKLVGSDDLAKIRMYVSVSDGRVWTSGTNRFGPLKPKIPSYLKIKARLFLASIEARVSQSWPTEETPEAMLSSGRGCCVRSALFYGGGAAEAVFDYSYKEMPDFETVWVMAVAWCPSSLISALLLVETESCHGHCFRRVGCCFWRWPPYCVAGEVLDDIEQRDVILI